MTEAIEKYEFTEPVKDDEGQIIGFGIREEVCTSAPRTASDLLACATKVQAERALDYDQPEGERSMGRVVEAFNTIKGRKILSESDGWLLQVLLKVARDQSREHVHLDSCKDLVSYSSLYGEARLGGR